MPLFSMPPDAAECNQVGECMMPRELGHTSLFTTLFPTDRKVRRTVCACVCVKKTFIERSFNCTERPVYMNAKIELRCKHAITRMNIV